MTSIRNVRKPAGGVSEMSEDFAGQREYRPYYCYLYEIFLTYLIHVRGVKNNSLSFS